MVLFDKDCQLSYNRINVMLWNSCLLCYLIFTDDNLVLSVVLREYILNDLSK